MKKQQNIIQKELKESILEYLPEERLKMFLDHELEYLYSSLKSGDTYEIRVYNLIKDLIGRAMLENFCQTIVDSSNINTSLQATCKRVLMVLKENSPEQMLTIPYIIIAMTSEQAQQLHNQQPPALQDLISFINDDNTNNNFTGYYTDNTDDWIPHNNCLEDRLSICKIMNKIIEEINNNPSCNLPIINLESWSLKFFSSNPQDRGKIWEKLFHQGGIVIIDSVSLFDDSIRKIFTATLSFAPDVSMLIISPFNPQRQLRGNEIINQLINENIPKTFSRFNSELDIRCDIGVGDFIKMKRSLSYILDSEIKRIKSSRGKLGVKNLIFGD